MVPKRLNVLPCQALKVSHPGPKRHLAVPAGFTLRTKSDQDGIALNVGHDGIAIGRANGLPNRRFSPRHTATHAGPCRTQRAHLPTY